MTDDTRPCVMVDGVLVPMTDEQIAQRADEEAQEFIDFKARRIAAVKAEAERRILSVMPAHEQRNALAHSLEMMALHGADIDAWPEDERQAHQTASEKWERIKTIRAYSDQLEATIAAKLKRHTLAAVDITSGWPD